MTLAEEIIQLIIALGPEAIKLIGDLEAAIKGTPGTPAHTAAVSNLEAAVAAQKGA